MKVTRFWLIFISSILLFGCKSLNNKSSEVSSISLSRGGCYGECPIYDVTFNKDGKIVYNGKMFVENIGKYLVNKEINFNFIQEIVEDANFFNLENEYLSAIADAPTVSITVVTNRGEKTIVENGIGPKKLKRIQFELDSMIKKTDSKDWKSIK